MMKTLKHISYIALLAMVSINQINAAVAGGADREADMAAAAAPMSAAERARVAAVAAAAEAAGYEGGGAGGRGGGAAAAAATRSSSFHLGYLPGDHLPRVLSYLPPSTIACIAPSALESSNKPFVRFINLARALAKLTTSNLKTGSLDLSGVVAVLDPADATYLSAMMRLDRKEAEAAIRADLESAVVRGSEEAKKFMAFAANHSMLGFSREESNSYLLAQAREGNVDAQKELATMVKMGFFDTPEAAWNYINSQIDRGDVYIRAVVFDCAKYDTYRGVFTEAGVSAALRGLATTNKEARELLYDKVASGTYGFTKEGGRKYLEDKIAAGDRDAQLALYRAASDLKLEPTPHENLKYLESKAFSGERLSDDTDAQNYLMGAILNYGGDYEGAAFTEEFARRYMQNMADKGNNVGLLDMVVLMDWGYTLEERYRLAASTNPEFFDLAFFGGFNDSIEARDRLLKAANTADPYALAGLAYINCLIKESEWKKSKSLKDLLVARGCTEIASACREACFAKVDLVWARKSLEMLADNGNKFAQGHLIRAAESDMLGFDEEWGADFLLKWTIRGNHSAKRAFRRVLERKESASPEDKERIFYQYYLPLIKAGDVGALHALAFAENPISVEDRMSWLLYHLKEGGGPVKDSTEFLTGSAVPLRWWEEMSTSDSKVREVREEFSWFTYEALLRLQAKYRQSMGV